MERHGTVIKVKPERLRDYKELHAAVWPEVLEATRERNLRNYSIYYKNGYLFSYYEYTGEDYDGDMASLAADPRTQEWERICMLCQEPVPGRAEGEWWAEMDEVFHLD